MLISVIFLTLILICVILLPSCPVFKWQVWILLIITNTVWFSSGWLLGYIPRWAPIRRCSSWQAGCQGLRQPAGVTGRFACIYPPAQLQVKNYDSRKCASLRLSVKKQARSFFVWFSIIHKKGGYFLVPYSAERLTCSPPNICVLHKLTKRKFKLLGQRWLHNRWHLYICILLQRSFGLTSLIY